MIMVGITNIKVGLPIAENQMILARIENAAYTVALNAKIKGEPEPLWLRVARTLKGVTV